MLQPLRQMYEAGAGCSSSRRSPTCRPICGGCSSRARSRSNNWRCCTSSCGVTALADLAAAIDAQAIRSVDGLDETVEAAVAAALPDLRAAIPRIPLGRAVGLVDPILSQLRALPGIDWALPVGSLRRAQDMVGDIEIVAAAADPIPALDAHRRPAGRRSRCCTRAPGASTCWSNRVQIGVRFPAPDNAGSTLLHLTGSAGHFDLLRAARRRPRLAADPRDCTATDGTLRTAASEEEIYAALDLPWIPPEIRNGDDEIAAAERGALPRAAHARRTSAATCTCTRSGATAATRSRRW